MKGISTVIATILMLLITVGMAGLAYMYISGMFTSRTAQTISLSSADCAGGDINILVKNDGTENIDTTAIDIYVDGGNAYDCKGAGNTTTAGGTTFCDSIAASQGTHTVQIVGPSNSISGPVYCAA